MNVRRLEFTLALVLFAVLTVSTASAAEANYELRPVDNSVDNIGDTVEIAIWLTNTVGVHSNQLMIESDPLCQELPCCCEGVSYTRNMTAFEDHSGGWVGVPGSWCKLTILCSHWSDEGDPAIQPPGEYHIGNFTVKCNSSCCERGLNFNTAKAWDNWGVPRTIEVTNGTFSCGVSVETFSKDLVEGWNLVSLPLEADDMTVESVFNSVGGSYSAIYSYDAVTKNFVALSETNVLENGVGYFISMNSADTWTYEGGAYLDMTVSLEQGLNMVGWLNCTKDIEDALSSIEGKYRYVARWDATSKSYEVYVPGAPSAFNDFDTMEQGVGYFISMKVDGETISEGC